MKFTTERLTIRPFKRDDLHDVFNIYNNDHTCKYLLHDKWTHENLDKEFNKKLENSSLSKDSMLSLAVVNHTKVIGDLSVWYTDMKDTVEIGFSFSDEVSGKGYATEAASRLVENLFNEFGVHVLKKELQKLINPELPFIRFPLAKLVQEVLQNLIETDEGSHYLGEIALVSNKSPLGQGYTLFTILCLTKIQPAILESATPPHPISTYQ